MKPEFIAIIGEKRIPTSARVIAIYQRTQGVVPFKFIPAPGTVIDPEQDEPAGADWNAK
jgi:hypothetical protein